MTRTSTASRFSAWLLFASLLVPAMGASAEDAEAEAAKTVPTAKRAAAVQLEATITAIDHDTRDVTLEGPEGNLFTLSASDDIERLDEFAVGDVVVATYLEAFAAELREPTEQELANPWQEVDDAEIASLDELPAAAGVRVVRAVCSIEGMNRLLGTVTLLDPRDNYHTVTDVDPEIMPELRIGAPVVVTFSQALALELEKPETTAPAS
ncbi:hypothetical protein [Parahaliea aestuarii]|uniref:YceI family protein n=1 Tax=Parahaliea aestuarii TaxID=1852021 RepID=A0A5C8ZTA4_9GAMM|nr:hypothetical protein [Parahaliea aestuarii]TXS91009.1 hypothetical protein FVW59_12415 [Parahaliea aestuarii]